VRDLAVFAQMNKPLLINRVCLGKAGVVRQVLKVQTSVTFVIVLLVSGKPHRIWLVDPFNAGPTNTGRHNPRRCFGVFGNLAHNSLRWSGLSLYMFLPTLLKCLFLGNFGFFFWFLMLDEGLEYQVTILIELIFYSIFERPEPSESFEVFLQLLLVVCPFFLCDFLGFFRLQRFQPFLELR
jgi:hypothetical protein